MKNIFVNILISVRKHVFMCVNLRINYQ